MTLRNLITPEKRRRKLKKIIKENGFVRIIEAHNGISALIANNTYIEIEQESKIIKVEFDGIWESSFTDSASKGYPDAEIIGFDSRIHNINQIISVTNKPIIVDGDTGGDRINFEYVVKTLESLGVSAIIIEDKIFPKRNSLSVDAIQNLEDPDVFASKIEIGKKVLLTNDFMIIARVESFIAGFDIKDALNRTKKYLLAGADGIMIHSKDSSPEKIFMFAKRYKELCNELGFRKALVCIPTTYNSVREDELKKYGFNIVIYANHLLRSSYKAMENISKIILLNRRSLECDPYCASVEEIFEDVGFNYVKQNDEFIESKYGLKAIIAAAGESEYFNKPKSLLKIGNKTLLERQKNTLKICGIRKIVAIRGFKKEKFKIKGITYYDNDDYKNSFELDSLFCADNEIEGRIIFLDSDVLFDKSIINNLINTENDIVVVIDKTYKYHKHLSDKLLDLVITKDLGFDYPYKIVSSFNKQIIRIGKKIDLNMSSGEFVGITYFSPEGTKALKKVYKSCKSIKGRFHEAKSLKMASITDILQEMIDRGYKVHFLEVNEGWIEIHNKNDKDIAEKMLSFSEG